MTLDLGKYNGSYNFSVSTADVGVFPPAEAPVRRIRSGVNVMVISCSPSHSSAWCLA